ncbi:hypothetical protein C5C66_03180 [Rathayibacter toxicus]|uniref:Multidrug ABC transporter ATPase n=2 Tax=Rathayibacter toxicus TaxID=145458 RepID=A0A0U1PUU9_9MICO|nr:hypothetical protein APU90_03100 [Rathayibacter toxicus]KKM46284.1 hypothetical protein VT73_04395 [Rathayibacter toxicus]PPG23425.1 hypothetical protein C5D15_03155 [Rathayibacter toxicus]PPG48009.1 hypothetical protein C5D16_03150 [Rathayibacter toxicus]PPH24977.1 hypothetical protein C5D17_03135 [Rathayibacter toxicus]
MFVGIIAIVIFAFLAILLAPAWGVREYTGPLWEFIFTLPLVGLPTSILMMIAMLIVGVHRRTS